MRFPNRDEDFYCYEKRISSGELSETAARLLLDAMDGKLTGKIGRHAIEAEFR